MKDTGKSAEITDGLWCYQPATGKCTAHFCKFKNAEATDEIYQLTQPDIIYHSSVQMSFIGSLARLFARNQLTCNQFTDSMPDH